MIRRPEDLSHLENELIHLASFGGLTGDSVYCAWYESVGIARKEQDSLAIIPEWAIQSLPASSGIDLLRRTVLRDPLYRLHIDLLIASTLHTIGVTERWDRLEELLVGPLQPFAPRLVSLLEWMTRRAGRPSWELAAGEWQRADLLAEADRALTASWDKQLWGSSKPSEVFPLLEELYVPLLGIPICPDREGTCKEARSILLNVITAASRGEAFVVNEQGFDHLENLCQAGVPLRLADHGPRHRMATLMEPVTWVGDRESDCETVPFVSPLPDSTRQSCVIASSSAELNSNAWRVIECQSPLYAPPGIPPTAASWPQAYPPGRPAWSALPTLEELSQIPRPRSSSPGADTALRSICDHPLMGFWFQLLLLEALDRELGDETLILAPPVDRRVSDIEAATLVLYRPRKQQDSSNGNNRRVATLGALDEVLTRLSRELGLHPLPLAINTSTGIWSFSLRMLRNAQLVKDRYDRWVLHPDALDRLHGGGLMKDVIRRGKGFRDQRLHGVLTTLWAQQTADAEVVHA